MTALARDTGLARAGRRAFVVGALALAASVAGAWFDTGAFLRAWLVSYVFWLLFMFLFCYFGAILPIWRYAQPVNYIGFWITGLTIVLGGLGALLAFFIFPVLFGRKL